jgi:hypothetical protein
MEPRGGDEVFIPVPNMCEKRRCQENDFEKETKKGKQKRVEEME